MIFDFLFQEAGFDVSEALIEYSSQDTYLKALLVGALNTLKVAIVGNILALFLGVLAGIFLLSKNWALQKLTKTSIEFLRNTPLLLQLFFWYGLFTEILPNVRQADGLFDLFYLTNRGLYLPWPEGLTGWSIPRLQGFNFQGGVHISPEFSALTLGLVLYTGAFIAEIVRSAVLSVEIGQWEAARALGLKDFKIMRLVVLPQALRVAIPPTTAQVLNLTKNSSLAVAIAYPDFVSIANTTMNQTGKAVHMIGLIMSFYLLFSLSTSFFMNRFNSWVESRGGSRV